MQKTIRFISAICLFGITLVAQAQQGRYLGNLTANPYLPPGLPQAPGTFNNPYGNSSNSPQLYDSLFRFAEPLLSFEVKLFRQAQSLLTPAFNMNG